MQLTTTGSLTGNRHVKAAIFGLVLLGLVWELAGWILAGSDRTLIMLGLGVLVVGIVVHILNDWQSGVLLFLVWLLFEDLPRKYAGNSMAIYFAKDFLVGIAYISFLAAKRRGRVARFKCPFQVPLLIFFALLFVECFNSASPSPFYGFLGLKLYLYYAPLMFLGYAMVEKPADLDRLLKVTLLAGIVICGLGIAQSVLGISFMNPGEEGSAIYSLSHLTRYSPVTGQAAFAPSSVFVSAGRFAFYLVMLFILALGAQGYLLLSRRAPAQYGYVAIGAITVAIMTCGERTPFVFAMGSAFVMTGAFLWGAPWKWGQGHRMVKALRRGFLVGGIGLILAAELFPSVLGGHWAFFSESLSPSSPGSILANRAWQYPVSNLLEAFQEGHFFTGHGTGMSSLGMQYVSEVLHESPPQYGVESGYGALFVELGIWGLITWAAWVWVLLWQGWRMVRKLRETIYFPFAFAIWWYAVVDLLLLMYFGIQAYQNFVNNAYLWLLIGVLYRLPKLAEMPQSVPLATASRRVPRWRLAVIGR